VKKDKKKVQPKRKPVEPRLIGRGRGAPTKGVVKKTIAKKVEKKPVVKKTTAKRVRKPLYTPPAKAGTRTITRATNLMRARKCQALGPEP